MYTAKFLQGSSAQRLLTASAWIPFVWDLETCQLLAEGAQIPAPELADKGKGPHMLGDLEVLLPA